MLFELLNTNREAIVQRVCEHASSGAPGARAALEAGVAAFLSQLSDLLFMRHADPAASSMERRAEMAKAAAEHGAVLLRHGFTLAQVVHEYGAIGGALVDIASERDLPLSHDDLVTIRQSVDAAVMGAVDEHADQRVGTLERELAQARRALQSAHAGWEWGAAGNHPQTQSR